MPKVWDSPLGSPNKQRRAFAEQSLLHFCYTYFAHHMPCEYGEWHTKTLYPMLEDALMPGGRLVAQCAREHGKTLVGTTFVSIYAVCKRLKKHIVLVLSSREDEGKNRLAEIVNELETNILLKNDYGAEIMPHLDKGGTASGAKSIAWRDEIVVMGNGCQIASVGFRGKLRGKKNVVNLMRPDLFILDDPENDNDVESEKERGKALRWFTGTLIPAMDEEQGSIIWMGTYLHFDSALWNIVHSKRFPGFDVKIIDNFVPGDKMPEGATILWPEKWTWDKIMKRYLDIMSDKHGGAEVFWREYMGTPLDKSKQVFPEDNWRFYDIEALRIENGHWFYQEGAVRWALRTRIAVDPAISEKAWSDFTAIIVSGQLDDGRVILLEIEQSRKPVSVTWERIRQLTGIYRPVKTVVEAQAFQALYSQRLWEQGLNVTEIKHHLRKEDRIMAMAGNIETHRVYLPTVDKKPTQGARALIDQAAMWTPVSHTKDDLLDALTMNLESTLVMRGNRGLVMLPNTRESERTIAGFGVSTGTRGKLKL